MVCCTCWIICSIKSWRIYHGIRWLYSKTQVFNCIHTCIYILNKLINHTHKHTRVCLHSVSIRTILPHCLGLLTCIYLYFLTYLYYMRVIWRFSSETAGRIVATFGMQVVCGRMNSMGYVRSRQTDRFGNFWRFSNFYIRLHGDVRRHHWEV